MCIRDRGIPHTVNGLDLLFQPQFAAQMLDMYIHRAGNADAGVTPGGMQPVSYTHLDVYKRQVQHDEERLLKRLLNANDKGQVAARKKQAAELNNCLLYTSRCV